MGETPTKPRKKGGKGLLKGKEDGIPFSAENQPSPDAKKAGWAKKLRGQELAKAVLELAFKGKANAETKKEAAEYYGIDTSEITVEMMLLFRQAEKAIDSSDTQAFNSIMDRAFGKPKEKIEAKTDNKITLRIVRGKANSAE